MTKKEISEILGVDQNTIKNWERSRPNLHKIVMEHFEKEKDTKNCNDVTYLKEEIFKALDKLPENQVKMYFHLIMAELAKNGH